MSYLKHYGTLGMRWGQRRYQNEDGSYKSGAEGRYYNGLSKRQQKKNARTFKKALRSKDMHFVDNKFSREVQKQFDKVTTKDDIKRISDLWNETYHSKKYKYVKDPNYADPRLDEKSEDLFYDNLEKYDAACREVTDRLLGKYGNIKVKAYKARTSQKLRDRVNFEISRGNVSRKFMKS